MGDNTYSLVWLFVLSLMISSQVQAEEKRVTELLEQQEYAEHPGTQHLIAMCRDEIKQARLKLATDRTLTAEAIAELWHLIDAREWVLKIVTKDVQSEIQRIEAEVDAEIERGL